MVEKRKKTPEASGGMQPIWVGRVAPDPHWRTKAHHHPHHEISFVLDGRMMVEAGGRRMDAVAGDVLWYPAGLAHEEWSDSQRPVETHFVAFAGGCALRDDWFKLHDARGRMRQMVRWMYEDGQETGSMARSERAFLLQAILAEMERGSGLDSHPAVLLTRRHVRDHIAEPISLDGLAKAAGLSKFHFLRLYKAETGRSPMRDVRLIRANYARELILGTDLPLKEIAPKAGLGDEYALSRIFRKLFGGAPGQYRRFRR